MRLKIFAGILLVAAFWLIMGHSPTSHLDADSRLDVALSSRQRSISPNWGRAGYGVVASGGFERYRAAVKQFSEDELLKMAGEDVSANDREALWRHAAIWERLGELKSERALDQLVESGKTSPVLNYFTDSIFDRAAHSFVGGWAGSLESLDEIQQDLFPQLAKLKEAGLYKYERALGREMARFDPMAAWNILSAPSAEDSVFSGSDEALSGLIHGLAGKPGLSRLLPFAQFRPIPELLTKLGDSGGLELSYSITQKTGVAPGLLSQGISDLGGLSSSTIVSGDLGDPLLLEFNDVVTFIDPRTPHIFSEAVGVLMLSNPEFAREYLKTSEFQPFDSQMVQPEKVWKKMAELDPDAAIRLLQDPGFEGFAQGIARGVVSASPGRLAEVLEYYSNPDEQLGLFSTAIDIGIPEGLSQNYPLDPETADWLDFEEVNFEIENAIESSLFDEEVRADLRARLSRSRDIPAAPSGFLSFDVEVSSTASGEAGNE